MRLCLAASGGGHVRQLLDLEPLWNRHDHFFVTEDTALGRSIAEKRSCFFVTHVALGQAKLGAPFKMAAAALRNCSQALSIIRKQRPDIVLTTGAGSMFFIILWARLFGAKIVLIDSFARFHKPSAFARIGGPLAHLRIAQSEESGRNWPGSVIFDPFRMLDGPGPAKDRLLFATVGATLPFERLVTLVADAASKGLIDEQVILQIGIGGMPPANIDSCETLPFEEIQAILKRADIVVCHGGTGSLITALREGCRVIAVPRRYERGEHYDNHQAEITETFRQRGLIEIADTPDEFAKALDRARARTPVRATTDQGRMIDYLEKWLKGAS